MKYGFYEYAQKLQRRLAEYRRRKQEWRNNGSPEGEELEWLRSELDGLSIMAEHLTSIAYSEGSER